MTVERNTTFIIKVHSNGSARYIANVIATRWMTNSRGQRVEKAYVYVPGHAIAYQWIPLTYFVAMAA